MEWSTTSSLEWCVEHLVVCVRGEGGPFYSPNRSVPRRDKGGNADSHLLEVKNDLPAKDEPEPPQ